MKTVNLINLTNAATQAAGQVAQLLDVNLDKVYVGGSLALVLQEVINREVHDIDIIVKTTNPEKYAAVLSAHNNLSHLKMELQRPSEGERYSYIVGNLQIDGTVYPINVILDTSVDSLSRERIGNTYLQHPTMIKWAKMSYKPQRLKDIKDIKAIIRWEDK